MAMKNKTTLEIDVTKLDKSKFREFTRKDGSKAVIARVEFIELTDHTVVTKQDGTPVQGNDSTLNKIGFVVEAQSPEQRAAKENGVTLGDATRWVNDTSSATQPVVEDMIQGESIPF